MHLIAQHDVDGLGERLGSWSTRTGPLHTRLAGALRACIDRGDISPGTRLPPERSLAQSLAISRSTVVSAYETLKDEGWLASRRGSGTYVECPPAGPTTREARTLSRSSLARSLLLGPEDIIDLALAAPLGAPNLVEAARAVSDQELVGATRGHGYAAGGVEALRAAIAHQLSARRLPTGKEHVLITSGAQQALVLLAALWLGPGENAVVENPTYHGALDAFRMAGAHLLSIPVDGQGACVEDLEHLIARGSVRMVYVTPTFNNPTGTVMSVARRRQLARFAEAFQVPVVEDLVLSETAHDDTPEPPCVASFTNSPWVISVGSMSKIFWGGLRVGWIRGSENTISRLASLKALADLGSPVLDQLVAARLLEQQPEIVAHRRRQFAFRLERLTSALSTMLPKWTWQRPRGGVSLWVRIPGNGRDFAEVALRHGVALVAGPAFSADESWADCIRIPFVLDPDQLEEAVIRLARAWRVYRQSPARAHAGMAIV